MERLKALSLSVGEVEEPVITSYRLGLILHQLYTVKAFKGEQLARLEKDYATSIEYRKSIEQLIKIGVLEEHPNFPGKVYRLLGRKSGDTSEVACAVDPFCYISHLSAMDYHGLTNRIPVRLFLSGPDSKHWKEEAKKQMQKDLSEDYQIYRQGGMPTLTRIKLRRIDRMEIHLSSTIRWGGYKKVRGKGIRVSTIGRTFLDMLKDPDLCGGMRHVIEVFENNAKLYEQAIVNEVNQFGSQIDKVRAGYILEERLGIQNHVVRSWIVHAARGGSRKLDPSTEYMPNWSETWCLSINI